jgi:hypothetical protein
MNADYDGQERRKWHVGKEIPVTVILALALQTGGFVWWLASLSAKVEETGRTIARLEAQIAGMSQVTTQSILNAAEIASVRIEQARMKAQLDSVQVEQQRRAPFIPRSPK